MNYPATALTDFYKYFHKAGTMGEITKMYENFTSRNGRLSNIPNNKEVTFVGLQYFIKDVLMKSWNETFFNVPKDRAIWNITRLTTNCLNQPNYDTSHFEALHDLGYLPLKIKALPEGVSVPYGVPPVTFINTVDGYEWLGGFLETVFSTENYPIQTSATTARAYLKRTFEAYDKAGLDHDGILFACHDFSMRGMFGRHAAAMSGFGHLCSFAGTDSIPAILFAEEYYRADIESELVGASVNATEHSISTTAILLLEKEYGITKLEAEVQYVEWLLETNPTGILSHVSDSFDFWSFIEKGLPQLKEKILARDGTFVVRPDSGEPVEVLCGIKGELQDSGLYRVFGGSTDSDDYRDITEAESKGLIQCLAEIFGTTTTEKGYKVLNPKIGAIYGDSITLDRQDKIITGLEGKGYAGNPVLGVGSYSYQYITRDTHGSAVKATWVESKGEGVNVFKDPKTDSKKKSAKGLLRVELEDGTYKLYDEQTPEQEEGGALEVVFLDGELVRETSLAEIRVNVLNSLK